MEESGDDNKNVQVYVKGLVATVAGLFMRGRQHITVDGISYSCGIPIEKKCNKITIQYMMVYRRLMVHNKKHKKGGWEKLAKHRDKSNMDFVGCKGND